MNKISSLLDWFVLLLTSPIILGLAIFCYLLWSDRCYDKKKRHESGKNKTRRENQG